MLTFLTSELKYAYKFYVYKKKSVALQRRVDIEL